MSNSFLNRILKSISVQTLHLVLAIIQQILLVPFFINYWGVSNYGNYIACFSLFSLFMSLDNGFGNYFTNEYNLNFHKKENYSLNLLSSSLKIVFVSNSLQLLFVFLLLGFQYVFDFDFFENSVLIGLLFLIVYRLFLGGSKGILVRTLYPLGLFHRSSLIGLGETILDLLILVLLIYFELNFTYVIFFIAIAKSFYAIFSFYLIFKWSGNSILDLRKKGNVKFGFDSYKKSVPLMLNSFLDKGSNDGLNTIIALTLGTASLPIFTTVKTMASMVNRLVNLIVQPLTPELGKFHSLGEKTKITDIFRLSWITTSFFVSIPIIIFSFFSEEIYEFWLNGELEFMPILYVTLMIGSLMYSYGNSYVSYMTSINYVKGLTIISFLRGLGILGLSYLFIYFFGLNGLGWSNFIMESVVSLFFPYILVAKIWNSDIPFVSKKEMLINIVVILLVCISIFSAVFLIYWQVTLISIIVIICLTILQVKKVSVSTQKKLFKFF